MSSCTIRTIHTTSQELDLLLTTFSMVFHIVSVTRPLKSLPEVLPQEHVICQPSPSYHLLLSRGGGPPWETVGFRLQPKSLVNLLRYTRALSGWYPRKAAWTAEGWLRISALLLTLASMMALIHPSIIHSLIHVDDAVSIIQCLAKLELKGAYRSVPVY